MQKLQKDQMEAISGGDLNFQDIKDLVVIVGKQLWDASLAKRVWEAYRENRPPTVTPL